MYNSTYRTAYTYNSLDPSRVAVRTIPSRNATPQDWIGRLFEDVTEKLYMMLQYTCCFPIGKVRRKRKKKKISFNLKTIPSSATISEEEEEILSPLAFDSLEVPELPVINPNLMNPNISKYQYNKKKIKNIFNKKKQRQLGNYRSKYRNKCCGQCIPLRNMTLSEYTLSSTCSHYSGDGPQNKDSRNRIINYFNEIYIPNDLDLPYELV